MSLIVIAFLFVWLAYGITQVTIGIVEMVFGLIALAITIGSLVTSTMWSGGVILWRTASAQPLRLP